MDFRLWFNYIKRIDLNKDFDNLFSNISQSDKRMHCIKSFFKTEINYLNKIRELLSTINKLYDRFSIRSIISKDQNLFFYQFFQIIFDLHYALHLEMINELKSSQLNGKVLIKFLVKSELSQVYLNYVDNCNELKNICANIISTDSSFQSLSLESIIMMPIQKFPQLYCIFSDLYKMTCYSDKERVNLYNVLCLIKSISMSLDQRQKIIESKEIIEIQKCMKQIKKPIKSKRIMFKSSVHYLKPNFNIPRKLIKLPYNLIVCENEIIIYPKKYSLNEIPQEMIFYYSFADTDIHIKDIFCFSIEKNSQHEFQKAKELFPLIKDSLISDKIIVEVEEILNDFNIINKIYDEVKNLNFRYNSIDQIKLSRSLLQIQGKLTEKEKELNNYFSSIINLIISESGSVKDSKMFQFDSSSLAKEWKFNFYRTKFSLGLNKSMYWLLTTKQKVSRVTYKEQSFPLLCSPYHLQENGIIHIKFNIIKCQVITIIIGTKLSRCLWLSMSNGYVVILHFNYKAWTMLESFPTKINGPISAICNFSVFDSNIADVQIDMEIWMCYRNQIISHSLLNNHRSIENYRINLNSEGTAICQVNENMFIGLKSLEIAIYSQRAYQEWSFKSIICLNKCIVSLDENIQNLIFDNEHIIYVVCRLQVLLYDISEDKNIPIKMFNSKENITCFNYCTDGIWIATSKNMNLILYDKFFYSALQTLNISTSYFGTCSYDSIKTIVLTDNYLWIGTQAGYIIIISTIDRLSCIDSKVTTYLNSNFSCASVDILLPFQNIHGYQVKNKRKTDFHKRNILDISSTHQKRSNSSPPSINTEKCASNCFSEQKDSLQLIDEVDSKMNNTFDCMKNSTPLFIIAFGNGLLQFSDFTKCDNIINLTSQCPLENKEILLTFLE